MLGTSLQCNFATLPCMAANYWAGCCAVLHALCSSLASELHKDDAAQALIHGQCQHHDTQSEKYAGAQGQPFILEADPLGFTQGTIVASDNTSQTIDMKLMDGYVRRKVAE